MFRALGLWVHRVFGGRLCQGRDRVRVLGSLAVVFVAHDWGLKHLQYWLLTSAPPLSPGFFISV